MLDWIGMVTSAFNAGFFLVYRSPLRRRWLGAKALAVVNLGILGQSLHGIAAGQEVGAAGQLLLSVGAALISLFILRQLLSRRGRCP